MLVGVQQQDSDRRSGDGEARAGYRTQSASSCLQTPRHGPPDPGSLGKGDLQLKPAAVVLFWVRETCCSESRPRSASSCLPAAVQGHGSGMGRGASARHPSHAELLVTVRLADSESLHAAAVESQVPVLLGG